MKCSVESVKQSDRCAEASIVVRVCNTGKF